MLVTGEAPSTLHLDGLGARGPERFDIFDMDDDFDGHDVQQLKESDGTQQPAPGVAVQPKPELVQEWAAVCEANAGGGAGAPNSEAGGSHLSAPAPPETETEKEERVAAILESLAPSWVHFWPLEQLEALAAVL